MGGASLLGTFSQWAAQAWNSEKQHSWPSRLLGKVRVERASYIYMQTEIKPRFKAMPEKFAWDNALDNYKIDKKILLCITSVVCSRYASLAM